MAAPQLENQGLVPAASRATCPNHQEKGLFLPFFPGCLWELDPSPTFPLVLPEPFQLGRAGVWPWPNLTTASLGCLVLLPKSWNHGIVLGKASRINLGPDAHKPMSPGATSPLPLNASRDGASCTALLDSLFHGDIFPNPQCCSTAQQGAEGLSPSPAPGQRWDSCRGALEGLGDSWSRCPSRCILEGNLAPSLCPRRVWSSGCRLRPEPAPGGRAGISRNLLLLRCSWPREAGLTWPEARGCPHVCDLCQGHPVIPVKSGTRAESSQILTPGLRF